MTDINYVENYIEDVKIENIVLNKALRIIEIQYENDDK